MTKPAQPSIPSLLMEARRALLQSQEMQGQMLGVSRRTVIRWDAGQSAPLRSQLAELARAVYAKDADLAARLASAAGESLDSIGLDEAAWVGMPSGAQGASLRLECVVDAIVCSAAEAMDAPPSAVRRSLLAAFKRADELGLTVRALHKALAAKRG